MAELQIKAKLGRGEPVMVLAGMHDGDMIDYLGQFGFDGVWLEGEHGPVDFAAIGDLTRACDLWNMASIVRVAVGEPWLITRTFDRGASGIVVPHVSTRDAAAAVVQAAKYAPLGLRGMYGSRRGYGVENAIARANDESVIVVLIEEIEAVENLAEILTVDHIDVFFVAPSDLAQTMGYVGQMNHPEVRATVDRAIGQIVAAGRTAGALTPDEASLAHYHGLGARFFLGSWLGWVATGARQTRARLDQLAAGG